MKKLKPGEFHTDRTIARKERRLIYRSDKPCQHNHKPYRFTLSDKCTSCVRMKLDTCPNKVGVEAEQRSK